MTGDEVRALLRRSNARGRRSLVQYNGAIRVVDVLNWPGPDRVLVWQQQPVEGVRLLLVEKIEWVGVLDLEEA